MNIQTKLIDTIKWGFDCPLIKKQESPEKRKAIKKLKKVHKKQLKEIKEK